MAYRHKGQPEDFTHLEELVHQAELGVCLHTNGTGKTTCKTCLVALPGVLVARAIDRLIAALSSNTGV